MLAMFSFQLKGRQLKENSARKNKMCWQITKALRNVYALAYH